MIHYLDVACGDCGAAPGAPCKRSMGPHPARHRARNDARAADELDPTNKDKWQ
jgi:hypothetical protein